MILTLQEYGRRKSGFYDSNHKSRVGQERPDIALEMPLFKAFFGVVAKMPILLLTRIIPDAGNNHTADWPFPGLLFCVGARFARGTYP